MILTIYCQSSIVGFDAMSRLERVLLWVIVAALVVNAAWWDYWLLRLLYAGH
jgi:hypothetical protein